MILGSIHSGSYKLGLPNTNALYLSALSLDTGSVAGIDPPNTDSADRQVLASLVFGFCFGFGFGFAADLWFAAGIVYNPSGWMINYLTDHSTDSMGYDRVLFTICVFPDFLYNQKIGINVIRSKNEPDLLTFLNSLPAIATIN